MRLSGYQNCTDTETTTPSHAETTRLVHLQTAIAISLAYIATHILLRNGQVELIESKTRRAFRRESVALGVTLAYQRHSYQLGAHNHGFAFGLDFVSCRNSVPSSMHTLRNRPRAHRRADGNGNERVMRSGGYHVLSSG